MTTPRQFRVEGYGLELALLPKSLSEARSLGARYFSTGKPCVRGHVSARLTKGGSCVICGRENAAKKRGTDYVPRRSYANLKKLEAFREQNTTFVPEYPCKHGHMLRFTMSGNCVECDRLARSRHKLSTKLSRIKKEYKISKDEYIELVKSHDSSCAICNTKYDDSFQLHIDHCHSSSIVRGLLCQKCNQGLGLFGDNVEILMKAIEYLKR